jgi:hypothetical protein
LLPDEYLIVHGRQLAGTGAVSRPLLPVFVRAPWTRAERVPHREATGSGLPGRHWGVNRQALLLDVKEALVDEFVDAEGT